MNNQIKKKKRYYYPNVFHKLYHKLLNYYLHQLKKYHNFFSPKTRLPPPPSQSQNLINQYHYVYGTNMRIRTQKWYLYQLSKDITYIGSVSFH